MEEIKEDYVSFETAKLLKEKGFEQKCEYGYTKNGEDSYDSTIDRLNANLYEKPTQALVVKWLLLKHKIYIFADPVYDFSAWTPRAYKRLAISSTYDGYDGLLEFNSPEEAIEAAIQYTLKNLI